MQVLKYLSAPSYDPAEAAKQDFDGRNAFDVAVAAGHGDAVVAPLLEQLLPLRGTSDNVEPVDAAQHGDAWFKAVQLERCHGAVAEVLARCARTDEALAAVEVRTCPLYSPYIAPI